MRVLITGASGFLGTALTRRLEERGDEVVPARRGESSRGVRWSTDDGFAPPEALSGLDAVVHLAGENVGAGRWTEARKQAILQSRIEGTRRVVEALRAASPRPRVLVSASAVGYYGDTGDRAAVEDDPPGHDFLAGVCVAWEREAREAEPFGVRVVHVRLGALMGSGGMLERLLPVFKMGVGGRIGDGKQSLSWIHIGDATRAIAFLLDRANASGPYNVTAPAPVTNEAFTATLGRVLHRPTLMAVPRFGIKLAFGEMGETVVLQGQRAVPNRLLEEGFSFEFPDLEPALKDLLT